MFAARHSTRYSRALLHVRRQFHASTRLQTEKKGLEDVYILSSSRTPIGAFNGALKSVSAPQLGSIAVCDAVDKAGINKADIDEVYFGNVVSANSGQAPARQVAILSKLPYNVPCTTVNKVCASGMKSTMLAAQSIQLGDNNCMVSGGMESMSQIPFYLPDLRSGKALGHGSVVDGIIKDGLWDAFDNHHMGMAAEHCATEYNFTREQQDAYALESYRRAKEATESGSFKEEIAPVEVPGRGGKVTIVDEDEEYSRVKPDKVPTLRPAFSKTGSVTAANASSINDGAAALVLASGSFVKSQKLVPLAKILSFADAAQKPIDFTTTPAKAIPLALEKAGLTVDDIDLWEINEAFSVVAQANMQLLGLDHAKVNVKGGAVALGHPIGASGARIITSLVYALRQRQLKYGVAAICNGGGGASAIVVELYHKEKQEKQ